MFDGIKLPRKLQRHVANLSTTVQVLLSELVLYVEGHQHGQMRKAETEYKWALETGKKHAALLADQLQGFVGNRKCDDVAIAVAASAGRSTGEIADFLGMEQEYVMRRLREIRRMAAKGQKAQHEAEQNDDATVLELFVEAQRKR